MTDTARHLRPVAVGDAAAITAIYAPIVVDTPISFEMEPPDADEMSRRIERVTRNDPWLVLEMEGQIVGYAYSTPFRDRPAYARTRETTVYVHDAARGRGAGRRLLRELLGLLRGRGVHTVVAAITLPNPASVALHEGLGFRPAGTLYEVGHKFGAWHDVGLWQLGPDLGSWADAGHGGP